MFDKIYELSLNKDYVRHWGAVEAVRELIQNAIDSESPFKYVFVKDGATTILKIISEFTTLSPQTLLLGSTSKYDSDDSIGSFGEGYKIAMLVLTRLNHAMEIHNGDKLWLPKFKFNKKFNDELLIVEESNLTVKNKGLKFFIHGLDNLQVESIKESCLQMQKEIGEIIETPYGDILIDKPGILYVGSLFICKTCLKYGYNILPKHIKLERDRQTVSDWDLKWLTKQMWVATGKYSEIATMISQEVPDIEYVRYDSTELIKEECYKIFKQKYPHSIVANSQEQLKSFVQRGMERVVVIKDVFYSQVSESQSYKKEKKEVMKTIHDELQEWYDHNKYHMHDGVKRNFQVILKQSKGWKRL
jgi:hypothetical protein